MFKSINYSRVICQQCNQETIILPGSSFKGLNCTCATDKSKPYQEIFLYTDGKNTVEVLGEFDNGDFEIRYQDGVLNYRIPHKTFIRDFNEVVHDIPPPAEGIVPEGSFTFRKFDYDSLTVKELKDMAKVKGIEGVSRLTKPQLIERLQDGKD